MPRDNSIKKVLVIGSGAIVIGQGAEFDYSGTQACRALREEGVEVVLVNSNPATIMTDKEIADKIYIEPLTIEFLEKVIAKEKPDSLIAGMGGQKGLNLAVDLYDKGILEKYNVRVIGTSIEAIKRGEDRESFKKVMTQINQPSIASEIVTNMEEGMAFAEEIGYPVIVRPAYTLGGTGGGIAENKQELEIIMEQGLEKSPVTQILLEKSIKGWKEIEYEVMRDAKGNRITVCNMENIDPVGVHTGDSIVVAPSQTLSDKEYQVLRKASLDIIEAVGIEGGCNVQLALNPNSFEYAVIEINPRVSRSSALASKATGYPIAKVAAKIALGYSLDEIRNDVTGKTFACFEPALDYVVVKIPKWPFDKFQAANRRLGTKMMATGEVMAIGRNFEAALLKGIRSIELEQYTLQKKSSMKKSLEELKKSIVTPDDERIFDLAEMIRMGYRLDKVEELTGVDMFFLEKMKGIILQEENLKTKTIDSLTEEELRTVKKVGFSDKGISQLINCNPAEVYGLRVKYNIHPTYKMVDTCSGEFEAVSPYYYSTYEQEDEVAVSDKKKVMVIGSGPIRIGQGIEFDYCSVHSVLALKKQGIETIIVNNNPETVSTDFNISDKLYFEPLTEEDVLNIIEKEKPYGVILQFGGQTAIKLSGFLRKMGVQVLGTSPEEIDRAEDREKFEALMESLNIKRPEGTAVNSVEKGIEVGNKLGYPVLVRPSYVLGGQGMEITYNQQELTKYLEAAFEKAPKKTVLIDRYLMGKEIEVDAISDGEDVLIPGIMEHLERAGVHSGDSISVYPPQNLTEKIKEKILDYTEKIAKALHVKGMINIQFIEQDGEIYIIEVNPRSSRTVPYISKVTDLPAIELATRVMLGAKLKELHYGVGVYPEADKVAVKVPVFSTEKLPLVEISLGPEMKSTGEVLGVGNTFSEALYKGMKASEVKLPKKGETVLVTIRDGDKEDFYPLAERMVKAGYDLVATGGTAAFLQWRGIEVTEINKVGEEKPTVLDAIKNKKIQLVINIPTKGNDVNRDGFRIRREAIEVGINVVTSLDTAEAMMEVLESEINMDTLEIINLGGKR